MSATRLERTTFATSRAMDFFNLKEMTTQSGAPPDLWPLVVLKELVDNALDACEDAGVQPKVDIVVHDSTITVIDNGPGIPAATVAGALDFDVRVSSREAYVAPDRGAQGNALKSVVAMPFVLDGEVGHVTVIGAGVRHEITVRVDPIRQVPAIVHEQFPDDTPGTTVTVTWPVSPWSSLRDMEGRFLQLAADFSFVNPHLTLTVEWFGETRVTSKGEPWEKWRPSDPTSPHWYGQGDFERLVCAYLAHDADGDAERSVRAFLGEFRGLSSTAKAKAILEETGLARVNLSALANGHLDSTALANLLAAMKAKSKPPKPVQLGVIGKAHLTTRLLAIGAEPESVNYVRKVGTTDDGVPWVVETAFAWCPELERRRLVMGVNWSPALANPFRELGAVGRSLDTVLTSQRAMADEPVAFVIHLAHARVRFTDRGKSAVTL